jgi:redox-sensitive bicupin YhaK (pirin superfamily)
VAGWARRGGGWRVVPCGMASDRVTGHDAASPTATAPSTGVVIDRAPLPTSGPWPTLDPFLFCVHHLDAYPRGNGRLGPDAPLDGRAIGNDFSVLDGWSMYHGSRVPGFPQHPHRGFETVTFVRRGLVDHSDSMGATARYGRGDVQWLTAGEGIVHAEMFPLTSTDGDNPLELFQIWVNLPAASKMARPHFAMLWAEDIPTVEERDDRGGRVSVTVAAGEYRGHTPPPPPPDSWAARAGSDVAIWLATLEAGASWDLPPARGGHATTRALYVPHNGSAVQVGGETLPAGTVAVVAGDHALRLTAEGPGEVLVLQGRPIGEPVAQYGPFVMNTEDEIRAAFADYRATGFGGWPWSDDDPNHGSDAGRFALHADGTLDEPPDPTG